MFRKGSFRVLPQKREMSLQKEKSPQPIVNSPKNVETKPSLEIVKSNGYSTKIHTTLKDAWVTQGQSVPDTKALFKANLPYVAGTRTRFMIIKNIQYILSSWTGDQFPSVIYIGVDGMSGYVNSKMESTTKLAALQLSQIAVTQQSGLRVYDLKYVLRDVVSWMVPTQLSNYVFRVFIDQSTQASILPLPNPLTLNVQIRSQ